MSDLFYDSFDHLALADQFRKWAIVGSSITIVAARTANGLKGTAAAARVDNTIRSEAFAAAGGYAGMAVKLDSLPGAEIDLFRLLDAGGAVILTVTVATDGTLNLYDGTFGAGGTLLASTPLSMLVASAWRYLELGWQLTPFGRWFEIRSYTPGNPVPRVSRKDAPAFTGAATWSSEEWHLFSGIVTIDDHYFSDDTTAINNDFKGSSKILITVSAAQDHASNHDFLAAAWTPNTGSDKAAVLDDAICDLETTYLYARAASLIYFTPVALTDGGERLSGVQMTSIARKLSAASSAQLYTQGTTSRPDLTSSYRAVGRVIQGDTATASIAAFNAALWFITYFA